MPAMLRSLVCVALAALTTADFGVGYDSYNSAQIDYHFSVIKQRFSSVRTFQTDMGSNNAITAAAKAGLKVAAAIWLLSDRYDLDLVT
ncbi:hypothetical protein AeMF1_008182 [Aphanomyces euteiches]|nr:hypothetical protein AeMF1_008182 [Aphanomyces euteiches]KAH9161077.1 hypothetical protein AeNC1_018939 [Aphanomyces euteiches]